MKQLEQYYRPDTELTRIVHELCDPALDFERHRDQVNELVLNLVIKYLAKYLQVDSRDPNSISSGISAKKSNKGPDFDNMLQGLLSGRTDTASLANLETTGINSLIDIRATSSIVKEIIFNQRYTKTDTFVGVDLGCGTGILSLASAIAAKRREVQAIVIAGFDINENLVREARNTLEDTISGVRFNLQAVDLESGSFWRNMTLPLSQWISETIGFITPPIGIEQKDGIPRVEIQENIESIASLILSSGSDPFPEILAITVRDRPQFVSDVQRGSTAMFPDIINDRYRPNNEQSTLSLTTARNTKHIPLNRVGEEFHQYESPATDGSRRW